MQSSFATVTFRPLLTVTDHCNSPGRAIGSLCESVYACALGVTYTNERPLVYISYTIYKNNLVNPRNRSIIVCGFLGGLLNNVFGVVQRFMCPSNVTF